MKVLLTRDQRILHKAGETVEVSPAEYNYLISTGSARPVTAQAEKPAKKAQEPAKKAQEPTKKTGPARTAKAQTGKATTKKR